MAFVYKRIRHLCRTLGIPVPSVPHRQAIGKLVAKVYHEQKINKPIHRRLIIEDDGAAVMALTYSKFFVSEIDRQIKLYFQGVSDTSSVPEVPRKVRKKIPSKKNPAYSATPKSIKNDQ